MPKNYRRTKLTQREIDRGLEAWLSMSQRPARVRPHIWEQLRASSGTANRFASIVASYERLKRSEREAVAEIMATESRSEVIRVSLLAAEKVLPDFKNRFGPKVFTPSSLLAAYSLRLYLSLSRRGFVSHLEKNFGERLLLFGDSIRLPSATIYLRFEAALSPEDFQTFLHHVEKSNPALSLILREGHNKPPPVTSDRN